MKMRKTMWAVCLAALMPISAEAVAATSYDEPQQKENTQTPVRDKILFIKSW